LLIKGQILPLRYCRLRDPGFGRNWWQSYRILHDSN